ncbi:MAG: DUF2878 domain-containing protein [Steroidobacteraceae bacterium]
MSPNHRTWINFGAMQAGWFACVLGAAHGAAWVGPPVALGVVLLHLAMSQHRSAELALSFIALGVGVSWETAAQATGWIRYNADGAFAPWWIFTMWPMFATTLNVSLRFLHGRWLAAALLGAVGAPLSYLAGARLGALALPDRNAAVALHAAGWALLMPLLIFLAARVSREAQR